MSRSIFFILTGLSLCLCTGRSQESQNKEEWLSLFNGKDTDNWIPKFHRHETGVNFGHTFRVEDNLLKVRYDEYGAFNEQFGHLFYKEPFSYYRLVVEYRFIDDPLYEDAPEYAKRNSGVMLHAQDPNTIPVDQDWPISVEMQFLGGLEDGNPRPTGNMCSPGTDILYNGVKYPDHCLNSDSETYYGEEWVRAEAIVLGDSLITHLINGDTVLQYSKPTMGGGVVHGYDSAIWEAGKPLTGGFIALQSEGAGLDFRKVELLNLRGCMDPKAKNYKSYYVKNDREDCVY